MMGECVTGNERVSGRQLFTRTGHAFEVRNGDPRRVAQVCTIPVRAARLTRGSVSFRSNYVYVPPSQIAIERDGATLVLEQVAAHAGAAVNRNADYHLNREAWTILKA
jgi:hypothetical protein